MEQFANSCLFQFFSSMGWRNQAPKSYPAQGLASEAFSSSLKLPVDPLSLGENWGGLWLIRDCVTVTENGDSGARLLE